MKYMILLCGSQQAYDARWPANGQGWPPTRMFQRSGASVFRQGLDGDHAHEQQQVR